jgi:YD repeat-containing protein
MTEPLNAVATWLYDADGRLTENIDRDNRTVTMAYDDSGRLLSESWRTSGGTLVNTQSWLYDHDGNITSAADNNGTYTLSYDPAIPCAHGIEEVGHAGQARPADFKAPTGSVVCSCHFRHDCLSWNDSARILT